MSGALQVSAKERNLKQTLFGHKPEVQRKRGENYRRTALDWLANYDQNVAPIATILQGVYGADWRIWRRRWRLFFLATAGLFGADGGDVWGVSHYRLKAAKESA